MTWEIWDTMDVDGSGAIDMEELEKWYASWIDTDLYVDRSAFIGRELVSSEEAMLRGASRHLGRTIFEVEDIYTRFKKLDTDGSGTIEYDEFEVLVQENFATSTGPAVSDKVVSTLWRECDVSQSQAVDFLGFAGWYLQFMKNDGKTPMEEYYAKLGTR